MNTNLDRPGTMPDMLEAALAFAARGWPVFPCDPQQDGPETPAAKKRAKRPLVPGADKGPDGKPVPKTGGLWRATVDEAQIRRWWKRRPDALIGVPTGQRIGAFVVDLDPRDETTADTLARLVEAVGALPGGPRSRTQSGGLHLWFRLPAGDEMPKNSAKRLKNIDWRGDGGYVIVPPSVMSDGQFYEWIVSLDDFPLPDAPARLLDLVFQRGDFARHPAPAEPDGDRPAMRPIASEEPGDRAVRQYARAALDRAARDVSGAVKGTRGFTLNAAAYGMAPFVSLGALSEREVSAALQDAADASGLTREDGPAERDAKIRRGLEAGAGNTGNLSSRLAEIREDARRKAGARRPPPPASPAEYGLPENEPASDPATPPSDDPVPGQDDRGTAHNPLGAFAPDAPGMAVDPATPDSLVTQWCARLDHSDTDNAARLIGHFGRNLLVVTQTKARAPLWAAWTGTHWDADTGSPRALAVAQRVGSRIAMEVDMLGPTEAEARVLEAAAKIEDREAAGEKLSKREESTLEVADAITERLRKRKEARIKHSVTSKNKGRMEAMLACAAPHVMRDPNDFNADKLKVAVADHTLAFRKWTAKTRNPAYDNPDDSREDLPEFVETVEAEMTVVAGHRRRDLITQVVPVRYDPDADCARWRAFMAQMLPVERVRRMVQIASGLGLLGVTVQKLFFHYGAGANGKSVYMETMCRMLGEAAVTLPASSFIGEGAAGGAATPDIARLYGRRFLRVKELPEGEELREAFVKEATGGEALSARDLFLGYFDFEPIFTAHMSGNGFPRITGTDEGIWRRMAVVHWPVQVPVAERVPFEEMLARFVPEYPGILNWLIEGALIFLREGLDIPDEVTAATAEMRFEMDPTAQFCRDCVTADDAAEVRGKPLYEAFVRHFKDQVGEHGKPISPHRFGRIMKKKYAYRDDRGTVYRLRLHDVPAAAGPGDYPEGYGGFGR